MTARVSRGWRQHSIRRPNGRDDPRSILRHLFDAALAAADPAHVLPPFLPAPPQGRTVVVGAGKAAAAMAKAVEDHWMGPITGLVITRYGHGLPCKTIDVVEAGHPLPDEAGIAAADRLLGLVRGLAPSDLVLCLLSGGASSLLALPPPGVSLADLRAVTAALLQCGAPIADINTVRKHLSIINGGRLAAAAAPARVVTLAISDVAGDDPGVIGSGPTVADSTTAADAAAVLAGYGIEPPPAIARHLSNEGWLSVKRDDRRLEGSSYHLVARPQASLEAAAAAARQLRILPIVLSDRMEGEARIVAQVHAAIARQAASGRLMVGPAPLSPPLVLLSGGETTVTVRGHGRGGRNAEFLLALALALDGCADVHALAADTDGIDGTEDNAGAICSPDTLTRAAALGISPKARLDDNDAWSVFSALDDLVVTGPTHTNVNDFRAIFVTPTAAPR